MMSFVLVWQHLQISLTLSRYMIISNDVGGPCASFSALESLSRLAGDDALCLSLATSPATYHTVQRQHANHQQTIAGKKKRRKKKYTQKIHTKNIYLYLYLQSSLSLSSLSFVHNIIHYSSSLSLPSLSSVHNTIHYSSSLSFFPFSGAPARVLRSGATFYDSYRRSEVLVVSFEAVSLSLVIANWHFPRLA